MAPTGLKYGRHKLALDVPGGAAVTRLDPGHGRLPSLGRHEVVAALETPEGSAPFVSLFRPGGKVTIAVPDVTRYSGAQIYLPPMLDALNSAGVDDGDITVVFATGIHRAQTQEERATLAGPEASRRVRLVDHDARAQDLAEVYVAELGRSVRLNRLAVECDRLVLTGVVGFHYLAGFGGGRKMVMPGLASYDDATRFHSLSLDPAGSGRRPSVRAGVMEGNPMNEYATAVARAVEPAFMLNTVQEPGGEVVGVAAGGLEAAFSRGAQMARDLGAVPIPGEGDVVVASCGGWPKDINFIQAHKTYEYASHALKPGGKMFLAAECPDGHGSDVFASWFKPGGSAAIGARLRDEFHINGQTALATAIKAETYDTTLLSSLDDDFVRRMGLRPARDEEAFLTEVREALRTARRAYVIPEGGYVLPEVEAA